MPTSPRNPAKPVIRLGIGDVTEPLPTVCTAALHAATDEMAVRATFKGYGPEQGYAFLREAVAQHDYAARGCAIEADEIFISDGSKCDCGNIQEIFATEGLKLAIPDPVYPVYIDTNVMAGRTGPNIEGRYAGITYLDCTPANGYVPAIPSVATDLIYLCFPNNPTGAVATKREQLVAWVAYAKANKAIILFDSAYEAYIRDPQIPALDLRNPRRARRRHRVPQLLQDRRLHRHALRLHRRPEIPPRLRSRRPDPLGPRPLESPPHNEVQRRRLSRSRKPPPRSTPPRARRR